MTLPSREAWGSTPGNWDPLHATELYPGESGYGFPLVPRQDPPPVLPERFLPWPNRRRAGPADGLHFFTDDYRFEPIWKEPARYKLAMQRAACVLSPDFSLFADMPRALQIWQTYRSRWMVRALMAMGAVVIPSVTWGAPSSFDFCFRGLHLVLG